MNKVSIKETYSINKKEIVTGVDVDQDGDITVSNNIYNVDGSDNGILFRRGDYWNCYIDESTENIIIKPPAGLNHSYTDVIFHDFRIYGYECVTVVPDAVRYEDPDGNPVVNPVVTVGLEKKRSIEIKSPIFLKCVQVPTLSRVVLKSHWNDYKSQYKLHLPRPFNVSDTLECYLANVISDRKITLNDLINEIGKQSLDLAENDEEELRITDISFDIEWISKTD